MTGATNGTVSIWNDGVVEKSKKLFNERTMVLFKESKIFAASENKDVVELKMNLKVVKKFHGRDTQPSTIDANENYLVVGYRMNFSWKIDYVGYVDVHSRHELDQNGTHQKRMVNSFEERNFDNHIQFLT